MENSNDRGQIDDIILFIGAMAEELCVFRNALIDGGFDQREALTLCTVLLEILMSDDSGEIQYVE